MRITCRWELTDGRLWPATSGRSGIKKRASATTGLKVDNSVHIFNKNTGENYLTWGDPHLQVDGQQAFDFWGTTTLALEDGTKVTIETTPWVNNSAMTLSSKVIITNAD